MENEQISFIRNNSKKSNFNFAKIVETEEQFRKIKSLKENYLEYIHCSGCFQRCLLSSPNCGRGIGTRTKLEGE